MESLIFTCLGHAATQLRETRLHPAQLLPVLPAAQDEGEQVLLREAGRVSPRPSRPLAVRLASEPSASAQHAG